MKFSLKNIDDREVSFADFPEAKGFMVVFTCNHCPYAIAYERRLVELQNRFGPQGVQLIAINPNDAQKYPQDSFEMMKIRAAQRGFNFPYLHDDSQEVAHSYGAERTPHVFLVQRKDDGQFEVVYSGAIDDSWDGASNVQEEYLAHAAEVMLSGQPIPKAKTPAVGCSIKWR
jgi:peroxiredoxin